MNISLPEELVVSLALVVELIEEKEVLELEGGNSFITFDDDLIDDVPIKEGLSLSLLLGFCQALMGVTTVILR